MKKLFVTILILLSVSVYAEDLLEVPPYLQGLWLTLAYSQDKGATLINGGEEPFLRMYSDKVLMNNGTTRTLNRIQTREDKGITYLFIHPSGLDSVWIISHKDEDTILVQVWHKERDVETARLLFRISR